MFVYLFICTVQLFNNKGKLNHSVITLHIVGYDEIKDSYVIIHRLIIVILRNIKYVLTCMFIICIYLNNIYNYTTPLYHLSII